MNHCHTCKFANWQKTPTGRISRKFPGQCGWTKTVRLAASTRGKYDGDSTHTFRGGSIWYDHDIKCQTYAKKTSTRGDVE